MTLNISVNSPITFDEFRERFAHMVKVSYEPKRAAILLEKYNEIAATWPKEIKNARTKQTRKRKR